MRGVLLHSPRLFQPIASSASTAPPFGRALYLTQPDTTKSGSLREPGALDLKEPDAQTALQAQEA